ncbi:MAG: cyclic nucleotide-binding domain-containing protein [Deltaproteobacteria bacterium]|nr:cyclic nucleotide-binding domain-containing protein [Deltaproteobacteria bacterium]
MDMLRGILGQNRYDINAVKGILKDCLVEKDLSYELSCKKLVSMGIEKEKAFMLLAYQISREKYGYTISYTTLSHILALVEEVEKEDPFHSLLKSPFFLVKSSWLFDHAPYFLFLKSGSAELDDYIIKFCRQYRNMFLKHKTPPASLGRLEKPRNVIAVSFWENQIFDPVLLIQKAIRENIQGVELSIDFHPFNYTRLLPEEISREKREEIKDAVERTGIELDIHSPIVGPYAPFPDPKKGQQLFFDPLNCLGLQEEVVELARDIGAGAIVFHLIDDADPEKFAGLVMKAAGSPVRVTLENYCHTKKEQNSDFFISKIGEISGILPGDVLRKNFGITLDVGHFNIEGEDPLISSAKIGKYCSDNNIFIRMHATDNYGELLFSPPTYSADVHGNVSGHGINNSAVIKLLRSMGHDIDVVAEQISPLTESDINIIHKAKTFKMSKSFHDYVMTGKEKFSKLEKEALINQDVTEESAYQFLAGLSGLPALREHLIYRKIQDKKYLSVEEVKKASQHFMKVPQKMKRDIIEYVDNLLLPIQSERGAINKSELDLICQNISGALFGTINSEHLDKIFSHEKIYNKGDLLCAQDTYGQEMFLVKEGQVEVLLDGTYLASLGPGEIFGELSLFYNVKRTASIKASEDNTHVGVLSRDVFETLLKGNQPYSYDLIYRLYNILPERLRNLNDKYKTAITALNIILNVKKDELKRFERKNLDMRTRTNLSIAIKEEDIRSVFKESRHFEADQIIFAEGDKADGAYYIINGSAKAVTFSSDYEEIVLGKIGAGEMFGEMALIDSKPRSATILVVSPCEVAYVDKKAFSKFIVSRSELAFRFMAFICLLLFQRILRLDKLYADIKKAFK